MLNYTNKLFWETTTPFLTISADNMVERIENELPCFEVTGTDCAITRLYFDIDYHITDNSFDKETDLYIKETGIKYIKECITNKFDKEPIISVATSSYDKKYSWRYFVSNIKMKKNELKYFVNKINEYVNETSDIYSVITKNGELFDTTIYDNNRKMRCINTSKPNENRPLILVDGSIRDTLITADLDSAELVNLDIPVKINVVTPTSVVDTHPDLSDIDYMLCVCIKEKMCQTGDNKDWTCIGQILKNELGDGATEPFLKWTYQFASENKKAEALNQITKYIKKTPLKDKNRLTIKSLHHYAKQHGAELYSARFCKLKSITTELDIDIDNVIFQNDDYSLATLFFKKYGSNFRCVDLKTKSCYSFNMEKIWQQFDCGIYIREILSNEMVNDFIKYQNNLSNLEKMLNSATEDAELIQRKIKKVAETIIKLGKTNDKNNITREIMDKIFDGDFEKTLNKTINLLPIKNGKVIDITTLETMERTIDHRFTYECDADFVELNEEQYNTINKYFLDLFCGNEKIKQCFINIIKSCLTGKPLRFIYFLTGTGRNGKSLFLNILNKILRKTIDVLDTKIILDEKVSSSLSTQFEKLDKCRIGYVTELKETDTLNTTLIKKISGGDPIDYRGLYKKNETIVPTLNLFACTNEMPKCKIEQAIMDRLIVVPFNNVFEIDPSFETKMLEMKDQIFSYILKYGVISSNFDLPEEMLVAKENYKEDNTAIDYLKEFIDKYYDIVEYVKDEKVKRDDFRTNYNNFLKEKGLKMDASSHQKFTRNMRSYNIGVKESHGKTYYTGLKDKIDEED